MKKLVAGFQRFQDHVFEEHRQLFTKLAGGQSPQALFITCSDSRVQPNLLTQSEPGDLFVLRNAGNIVPAYGPTPSAEAGTIEYAIEALGVEDVVVCGHSQCGAMNAILADQPAAGLPSVASWLVHAEPTRRILRDAYGDRPPEEKLNIAIQENVLQQIVNLRTHPSVAAKLACGRLSLHAWIYKIGTGEIFAYDPGSGQFKPLLELRSPKISRRSLADALGA
jgi:carbonic anhydrase